MKLKRAEPEDARNARVILSKILCAVDAVLRQQEDFPDELAAVLWILRQAEVSAEEAQIMHHVSHWGE